MRMSNVQRTGGEARVWPGSKGCEAPRVSRFSSLFLRVGRQSKDLGANGGLASLPRRRRLAGTN